MIIGPFYTYIIVE